MASPMPWQREELVALALEQYVPGMSLQVIAESTDRSHSAVRNLLDRRAVRRPAVGAARTGHEQRPSRGLNSRTPTCDRERGFACWLVDAAASPRFCRLARGCSEFGQPLQHSSETGWRRS
jgi:hypothetical protein